VHWPVPQSRCVLSTTLQFVRGQKVPEVQVCGMQKVSVVLHLPFAWHVAPPEQSLDVEQVH